MHNLNGGGYGCPLFSTMTLNELEQTIAKLKEQGVDGNEQVYIEDRESCTIEPVLKIEKTTAYKFTTKNFAGEKIKVKTLQVYVGADKIKVLLIS